MPQPGETDPIEEGSNAWAFAPSRTTSRRAILVRNPHLAWTAGYYEAHVSIPGALDFYGDFRIGGPIGVIGGFNRDLGWATTNNAPDLTDIYSVPVRDAEVRTRSVAVESTQTLVVAPTTISVVAPRVIEPTNAAFPVSPASVPLTASASVPSQTRISSARTRRRPRRCISCASSFPLRCARS